VKNQNLLFGHFYQKKIELLQGKNIGSVYAAGNYTLALSDVSYPLNCGCARGGRLPTSFNSRQKPAPPKQPPTQPVFSPSDLYLPVEPFGRRKRIQDSKTLPGEVDFVAPKTMAEVPALDMAEILTGKQNIPEIAPKLANLVYYPVGSNEQKAFGEGIKKGEPIRLFGADVTADGYFYGDVDKDAANWNGFNEMPAPTGNSLMPETSKNLDTMGVTASKSSNREIGVFSLSLEDVRAARTNGDYDMKKSVMDCITDYDDNRSPVNFNTLPVVAVDEISDLIAVGPEKDVENKAPVL